MDHSWKEQLDWKQLHALPPEQPRSSQTDDSCLVSRPGVVPAHSTSYLHSKGMVWEFYQFWPVTEQPQMCPFEWSSSKLSGTTLWLVRLIHLIQSPDSLTFLEDFHKVAFFFLTYWLTHLPIYQFLPDLFKRNRLHLSTRELDLRLLQKTNTLLI